MATKNLREEIPEFWAALSSILPDSVDHTVVPTAEETALPFILYNGIGAEQQLELFAQVFHSFLKLTPKLPPSAVHDGSVGSNSLLRSVKQEL